MKPRNRTQPKGVIPKAEDWRAKLQAEVQEARVRLDRNIEEARRRGIPLKRIFEEKDRPT